MNLNLTTKKINTDCEIVLVKNKRIKENKKLLKTLNFKGSDEECVLLPELGKIYVGCEEFTHDNIRIAVATAVKKLNSTNFKSAYIKVKSNLNSYVDGFELGNYAFTNYKSEDDKTIEKNIYMEVNKIDTDIQKEFEEAVAICNSVNMVRDFVNTAPEDFYPEVMAKHAISIAKDNGLECKILDEDYLEENEFKSNN